jgi:NitT/TauT family transport system permease protein
MNMAPIMPPPPSRPGKSRRRTMTWDTPRLRSLIQFAAVVAFFTLWQIGVQAGFVSSFLVGSPLKIGAQLILHIRDGSLLLDTGYTLYEAMAGFVIGTVAGSIAGLGLWYSVFVARLVEPFVVAINSVPKIALAPVIVLWFGTGIGSKVALAISLTSLVALIAAYQAAKDADVDLQALLFSMGASKHRIFTRVIVPSTLPGIIATFRINIGFGLVGAVVGEFISSQHGLGHMIYTASSFYDLDNVWAGIFTLMLAGFLLYFAIDFIESRLLPWKTVTNQRNLRV